nr:hypothetical protein [Tanacetum cinerariifolium]
PGIAKTNFDPKENIRLIKKLLYDNSSPRPPEGLNSVNDFEKENSGSITIHTYISLIEYESFYDESDYASEIFNDDLARIISPSNTVITSPKIDFLLEEFVGELALINPIPPGIAKTNFDLKENILLIKKLLYDNSSPRPPKGLNSVNDFEKENSGSITIHTYISLIEYESFYDESDYASEIFNDDLARIISPSMFDTLLPLSSENKDKVFNPRILISKEEKSHPLLSHRGLKVF